MKKIVLRNLPPDIHRMIDERASTDRVPAEEAVLRILRDIEIERAIEHDVAILRESWDDDEDESAAPHCCHEHHCFQRNAS